MLVLSLVIGDLLKTHLANFFYPHTNLPTLMSHPLQSLATWETENKIHCQQTLVDGDGPKTYWTRELNGDELILVSAQQ